MPSAAASVREGLGNLGQVRLLDPQTGQLLREHLRQARGVPVDRIRIYVHLLPVPPGYPVPIPERRRFRWHRTDPGDENPDLYR